MEWRGLSVCRSVTNVSHEKTAKPIDMWFGMWTMVGQGNHLLDSCSHLPMRRGSFGGKGRPIVKTGTLCCKLCKNGWIDRDIVCDVDSGTSKEACIRWSAHWRNAANTTEPVFCDDAAFLSNYVVRLFFFCSMVLSVSTGKTIVTVTVGLTLRVTYFWKAVDGRQTQCYKLQNSVAWWELSYT